ncbi:MAG: YeeE/YedE [Betaproteobacteria bacterium RIFCSPLOWO2_12_FULL_62_58]|nr:MAG: YeeE/YedE [Betaproteobacteria bacterium RIFCSPLOWO2_12_FULL_62_58]
MAGKAPDVAPAHPQYAVAAAGLALGGLLLVSLPGEGWRMRVLLLLGMALGGTLYLTSFSFTSAYRAFMLNRETAGLQAQLLMLALATVLFTPVLAAGSAFGHSISGAVAPVGMQVVAGAFLFGLGMQLAGGCGSGTLFTAGGGSVRMLVVLLFFCAGSFWASLHMSWWERLPSRGEIVLGEHLGWTLAVALQLGICAAAWAWLGRVARGNAERPRPRISVLGGDYTLLVGAALLAVLAFLVLLVAGHPWSITWAFALWGAKAALPFGWQPDASAFWNGDFQRRALESSIFEDVTSVTDIGIVLGALAAAGVAGRFRPQASFSAASLTAAVVGGLAMGYGARIAYGCNIGAFFSGVASTSLHGWVWIVAALGGTAIGVRLRPWFGLKNQPGG